MTFGAVAVGVVIVALIATGILGGHQVTTSGLLQPQDQSPATLANGRVLGKADAPVTIDLWSDFQCSACGSFVRDVEPEMVQNLIDTGKAKVVYHDYILIDSYVQGGHESLDAATAARCAGEQGKFWQYHDWLFANQIGENQNAFKRTKLDDMAFAAGLDQAKFDSCYDSGAARQAASAESTEGTKLQYKDATGKAVTGINHTPTLIINGQEINPSYDALAAAVNAPAGAAPSGASPSASAGSSSSVAPSGSTAP